jgi:hypothetical protein
MATVLERPSIKVEKGVPFTRYQHIARGVYPFAEMDVGDSFFAPGVSATQMGSRCAYQKLKYQKRFSIRAVDGGVRVWRLA